MKNTPFELVLSDELQSILDHFAALLDIRVTFFSADGKPLRRGCEMRNSEYCRLVQEDLGRLHECISLDADKRREAAATRGILDYQLPRRTPRSHRPPLRPRSPRRLPDDRSNPPRRHAAARYARPAAAPANSAAPSPPPSTNSPSCRSKSSTTCSDSSARCSTISSSANSRSSRGDRLKVEIDRYLDLYCTGDVRLPEMARKLNRSVSTISQFLRNNYPHQLQRASH